MIILDKGRCGRQLHRRKVGFIRYGMTLMYVDIIEKGRAGSKVKVHKNNAKNTSITMQYQVVSP